MSQIITAIFDGETLHPKTPLNLSPNQRYQVIITPVSEKMASVDKTEIIFPTFKLGVKDEYLSREKIYDADYSIV